MPAGRRRPRRVGSGSAGGSEQAGLRAGHGGFAARTAELGQVEFHPRTVQPQPVSRLAEALAQQLGLGHGDLAGQLSQILPQVVDHLTPGGQVPQGGLGSVADILGQLVQAR